MSTSEPVRANPVLSAILNLLRVGAFLGSLATWLIGVIVCYDVLMRYWGQPTLWALEISTYLMIGAAVFASGLAIVNNDHFSVDIFPNSLARKKRRVLDFAINFSCMVLTAFVAYGFWKLTAISYRFELNSATLLHIPLMYPQGATLIGFALMVLGFIYKLFSGK